jgi:hypothetical protein
VLPVSQPDSEFIPLITRFKGAKKHSAPNLFLAPPPLSIVFLD